MSYSSEIKDQLTSLEIKKECCRANYALGLSLGDPCPQCDKDAGVYLRGVFVKCGSVSPPGRDFMLSFTLPDEGYAAKLTDILSSLGLEPRLTRRKGKPVVYFKRSDDIGDVLSICGGVKAALGIMSEKVMSDVRNNANRVTNAETANLDRTARAAAEQIEAIRKLQSAGILQNLPQELRDCAAARLEHPEMNLVELCAVMREPISKSGLNYRLKKLIETAEEL